jgi:hypothetical protein
VRFIGFKTYRSFTAFALLGVTFLVSCAGGTDSLVTECVVNPDQKTTFKGHWTVKPVPLAVEVSDFSASEITAIQGAIDTWNEFYQASKGFKLYLNNGSSMGYVSASGSRITSATACSQTLVGPNGFTNKIMIYKNRAWGASLGGSSVMALTSLCPVTTANSSLRMFIAAVMEINFTNYFVAGNPVPDLQSIVVHELGHMLGLDHSCTGAACTNAPSEYKTSIMYPSLGFDGLFGRVRRTLGVNDQQRANCLY